MTPLQDVGVAGAGFLVGIVNTIAGAGSLLSFPVLLATGLSPLAANVTNTVGVVPGAISGSVSQRDELSGLQPRMTTLAWPMVTGSLIGTLLLLTLPGTVFNQIIPVLVGVACLLVLAQPLVKRRAERRGTEPVTRLKAAMGTMFVLGIYGGYFGAAVGILLIGILGLLLPEPLRRTNARKTVLQGVTNGTAALVFAVAGPVHWVLALLLGVPSLVGGSVGARIGRRISPGPLRVLIAVIGFGVAIHLAIDAY